VAELFEIQARAHKFIHHIIPRPDKEKFAPAKANFENGQLLIPQFFNGFTPPSPLIYLPPF
jgi:hypothetical protein